MDKQTQTELEAAAFRRLLRHLQEHTEAQNIDLMIVADFCRNCLAKWYAAEATDRNLPIDYEQAREIIYGMPYEQWKGLYQQPATAAQMAAYEQKQQAKQQLAIEQTDGNLFSGVIGEAYDMLKLICPLATEMSRLVGKAVSTYPAQDKPLKIVEIGGGTGITTLSMLTARDDVNIYSIDSSATMLNQAKSSLKTWLEQGAVDFAEADALAALKQIPAQSVDIVGSAYTIHNFEHSYREAVIQEIYRILKVGGQFINGDRYALDDISEHTRLVQQEISGYFKVLIEVGRLDLLEQWLVHLFNDESENHVMRETYSIKQLFAAGFSDVDLSNRLEVNALVIASKGQ